MIVVKATAVEVCEMTKSATDRVRVVSPGQTYVGKQGFTYGSGASAETVGARRICMNILPMPAGARAKAHYHKGIETIAYEETDHFQITQMFLTRREAMLRELLSDPESQ